MPTIHTVYTIGTLKRGHIANIKNKKGAGARGEVDECVYGGE